MSPSTPTHLRHAGKRNKQTGTHTVEERERERERERDGHDG